jgi:hypothetical protein
VADEEFDGTDMVFYLLGERQRSAHEARKALPQGIVEPFDMIGFPRLLRDGFVALRRNDAVIHFGIVSKPAQKFVGRLTLFQGVSQVLSHRKTT